MTKSETVKYETPWGSFTLIVDKEFDANTPIKFKDGKLEMVDVTKGINTIPVITSNEWHDFDLYMVYTDATLDVLKKLDRENHPGRFSSTDILSLKKWVEDAGYKFLHITMLKGIVYGTKEYEKILEYRNKENTLITFRGNY